MDDTQAQLNSHVDVCTLRYEMLCARIKRLENIMLGVSGVMITSCRDDGFANFHLLLWM